MSNAIPDSPPDFELIPCPGCGSGKFTASFIGHGPPDERDGNYQVVRCSGCGLHYQNPRPLIETLGRYYPTDYSPYQSDNGDAAGKEGSLRQLVLRDAFGAPSVRPSGFKRILARTIETFRRPEWFGFGVPYRGRGRLLDFGCGSGKFLRRMAALGWDVTGLDFSQQAVESVRSQGLRTLQGTLPHPELSAGSFDVVTMRHALEHVPDPPAILRAARDLLDTNGLLVIQVPNYDAWDIDYFKDASMGLDLPRHLTHFTPKTLSAMLTKEGFHPTSVRQISRPNWIRKAAKRCKDGPEFRSLFRSSPVCRIAATLCEWRGKGNEIIAAAEKA